MASIVAKIISKKILGETLQNNFGKEDPYFETVPATRLDGRQHKTKTVKRRKALPAGLSQHDERILTKVKRRAYRLDMSLFSFFGARFGWSSVIGIIPAIGDFVDLFMAMMVLRTCQQVEGGLPNTVKSKMMFNIIIDFAIGLVPFLGDIADALFRANTKNAVLLEEHLREKGAKALKAHGIPVPAVDPSDPDEFDKHISSPPPAYGTATPSRHGNTANNVSTAHTQAQHGARPAPAEGGSSFFGFGKKKKQTDIEQGRHESRRDDAPLQPPRPNNQSSRLQTTTS
ncbi:hypothetical protein BJ878DRAFT_423489 [Calycina marina]|uniref:PH domain-containing protein n=1 Tax=Calycina marina TaxID=1763456 RepID=A0A9P7Z159_9HELO|nr:hypothetical protein BJ878DRAFT_423489 [Calycina marina]